MAEINIERKPERSPWPIVLAVLAVLAIAVAVWYFTQQPTVQDDAAGIPPSSLHVPASLSVPGRAA